MNKKIIISIFILTCLAFMPISAQADYPSGTLGYSDDISVGKEFEWTIDTLELTGEFATYTTDLYIGTEFLNQGDKIKIVVTEDPDTAVGDWFEVYVDGNLVDPNFGLLLDYGLHYTFGGFFISPITYTNATGTYQIYEQLMEELGDYYYDETYETSTISGPYTYTMGYTYEMSFSLEGDVFSYYMYEYEYLQQTGEETLYMKTLIQASTNVKTGLMGTMEVLLDFNVVPYMVGKMHLFIDSDYAPIDGTKTLPFAWGYSLLGVSTLAILVVFVKRKRN